VILHNVAICMCIAVLIIHIAVIIMCYCSVIIIMCIDGIECVLALLLFGICCNYYVYAVITMCS